MEQKRLSTGPLLNAKGDLTEAGYATSLVKEYRRKDAKGVSRIKEWDYYLITDGKKGVALTIADNSYMGLISLSLLDFENRCEKTVSPMTVFPFGKTGLPATSAEGDVGVDMKSVKMDFVHTEEGRRLTCTMPNFADGKEAFVDILLTDEPAESMVIATPFEKKAHFYYNQKIIGMRAAGCIALGDESYVFTPDASFGLLDWGRGVWTYSNTWYWGALMCEADGHTFGFNIGYGFGDTSAATENMLFYDGIAHKLEHVAFNIPKTADGKDDFLSPWTFTSSDGRLELSFAPVLDRASLTSALIILSDQHQVFGHFSGKAILDDGTEVIIKEALGFAEKVRNKW